MYNLSQYLLFFCCTIPCSISLPGGIEVTRFPRLLSIRSIYVHRQTDCRRCVRLILSLVPSCLVHCKQQGTYAISVIFMTPIPLVVDFPFSPPFAGDVCSLAADLRYDGLAGLFFISSPDKKPAKRFKSKPKGMRAAMALLAFCCCPWSFDPTLGPGCFVQPGYYQGNAGAEEHEHEHVLPSILHEQLLLSGSSTSPGRPCPYTGGSWLGLARGFGFGSGSGPWLWLWLWPRSPNTNVMLSWQTGDDDSASTSL